jgi:hypothetical protein
MASYSGASEQSRGGASSGGLAQRLGAFLGADIAQPAEHVDDRILPGPISKPSDGIDLMRMFPAGFTMTCCLIYLVPFWLVMTVTQTPALSYFASHWSYLALAVPIIIVAVHFVHLQKGVPNKLAITSALVIPSLLLLVIADWQYMSAVDQMDKLFSTDCDTSPQKRALQSSWEVAYSFYMDCLEDTASNSSYSMEVLQENFRIQDCAEYTAMKTGFNAHGVKTNMLSYKKEWNYLQYLEENHFCSGWCYHGVQLWSTKPHKDSCATVVSSLFGSIVKPHSMQVFVVMLVSLAATAVILIGMGPKLRKHGIDW